MSIIDIVFVLIVIGVVMFINGVVVIATLFWLATSFLGYSPHVGNSGCGRPITRTN